MNSFDTPSTLHWPQLTRAAKTLDPLEQMARDDRDDWVLLRLVVCVAVATMALAIASTVV
jgi:hypothetical protein